MDPQNLASVLDLAIFAEMYIICQLKNQTSDILCIELGSGRWQLTPNDISMVYDEVPSDSILRQLCSVSLAFPVTDPASLGFGYSSGFGGLPNVARTHRLHNNYLEWESVFEKHSDLVGIISDKYRLVLHKPRSIGEGHAGFTITEIYLV